MRPTVWKQKIWVHSHRQWISGKEHSFLKLQEVRTVQKNVDEGILGDVKAPERLESTSCDHIQDHTFGHLCYTAAQREQSVYTSSPHFFPSIVFHALHLASLHSFSMSKTELFLMNSDLTCEDKNRE